MEVYKYRIKRSNPSIYWTAPCTGATNFWPINTSSNCSGITMYNSTFSEVKNALNGDMNNFPQELTGCSVINPCVILNDTTTLPIFAPQAPIGNPGNPTPSPFCLDIASHPYILFTGLNLSQNGVVTFMGESYNDMISIFGATNSTLSKPLNTQISANLTPSSTSCYCPTPLGGNVSQIPLLLSQDYNDIGHYDIWDGNIGQKDIFSNFVVTATTSVGNKIKIWNSTDFGYYKSFQDSPYTINWGDCPCDCLTPPCQNSFGEPCCETLQFPNLTNPSPHTYAGVGTRKITITHDSPWGPTSVSQAITVPFKSYNSLLATGGIPSSVSPVIGPNGPVGTNSYFGAYPFSPLDSGTDILQYSGLSPIFAGGNNNDCFDVTGNTESLLGAFQSYTTLNTAGLPPGYQEGVSVPLMGEVLNPLTNTMVPGVMGMILVGGVTPQYTAYTISVGTNTPITFYDFSNGVTLYEAVSCGLDAFAFGAFDCVKCEIGDCTYCETKDEYVDRITLLPMAITFNSQLGEWSPSVDYVVGDIVFDSTWGECCCYMAVKNITQIGSGASPWAGIKPTNTFQGVWWYNGQPTEHIWEACSPHCESCPDYTSIPCYDPTNDWNAYPTTLPVGPAGVYSNGSNYNVGQFTLGQYGNCYRALSSGTLPPPSGLTNNAYWDYIGCSSWICPPVSALTSSTVACELVPGTGSTVIGPCTSIGYTAYADCIDDFYAGDCCEDRFICVNQYTCEGCSGITSAHPMYNDPSALDPTQGPVFDSPLDCELWCDPPAYSCTTATTASGGNCCATISCGQELYPGYYSDMITPITNFLPSTPAPYLTMNEYIAATYELWFEPDFTISNCNNGVVGIGSACCDYTVWKYNCEFGCYQDIGGTGWTTFNDCEFANPGWVMGNTICGYNCEVPCDPCVPCYTLMCGNASEVDCNLNCSCETQCYVCDCYYDSSAGGSECMPYYDASGLWTCPHWPTNEGIPLVPGDPLTFLNEIDCLGQCPCDIGWDCYGWAESFVLDGEIIPAGTSIDGCTTYPSLAIMQLEGAIFSPGSPTDPYGNPTGYSSFSACCIATECCHAKCEIDPILYTGWYGLEYPDVPVVYPHQQNGSGGNFPCHWVSQTGPDVTSCVSTTCCSPAFTNCVGVNTGIIDCFAQNPNVPYCDMVDCVNALCPDLNSATATTCCVPQYDTCICACMDYTSGWGIVLDPSGPWNNFDVYEMYDTVSYGDGNTPDCCWICMCPMVNTGPGGSLGTGAAIYDCNTSIPDDGPYTNGTPNCWESCLRLPAPFTAGTSNVIGEPCGPCGGIIPDQTYECTPEGCQMSNCIYSPGAFGISQWQTQNNCYTASTCGTPAFGLADECRADCYCADPDPLNEVSNCVVLQDYLNDIYSPGSGNLGIYWMGYSPFPMTYPPVQPGNLFLSLGLYFWPYDSLSTCQSSLATGAYDCCTGTTSAQTWDCDNSCNCPTVNGNPCNGGTGCYPVNGTTGVFTSLSACQEWCTWECNTNGAQICQFIAMSSAPTIYLSALDCQTSNSNCECGTVDEWWCDWAGADNGDYNSLNAQPCQQSSFFIGKGTAYQSMAIGQGMGGPVDPTNNYYYAVVQGNTPVGQGFPNQGACEQMCRFCCDCAPPGTGNCDLCGDPLGPICAWGSDTCDPGGISNCANIASSTSPYLCQQANPNGCTIAMTEYCCHPIDGCLSYIGAAPTGTDGNPCVTFFGSNSAGCTLECNFACGDCNGQDWTCHCVFEPTPNLTYCPPYPFSSMALCEAHVTTITILEDDGSCCKCYSCEAGSPVSYLAWDTTTTAWITFNTAVNPIPGGGAQAWAPVAYNTGDVVYNEDDGILCCYVCVWGTGLGNEPDWNIPPYWYYNLYVNDVSAGTLIWPGGGSLNLVWVPCDPGCPNASITTYDCIPGIITDTCEYDTFGNLYNLVLPNIILLNMTDVLEFISDPTGVPYLQTQDIRTFKFPYGGWPLGTPINSCLHNSFPIATAGGPISIDSDMTVTYGIPQGYYSWSSMIASLQSVNIVDSTGNVVSLANTREEICEAIWMSIGSVPGSYAKCITITLDYCLCTQSPCSCLLVPGPTGQFMNIGDCQQTLTNVPCCGSWVCDGTPSCLCSFVPNLLTGFDTALDCYTASNCCEVQYPDYECVITVPSPSINIPDLCHCVQTPGGTYTGINALYLCQTDVTTCCSATTLPDRWKCTADCSCAVDPYGPYGTLHDCQTAISHNCCYTGTTNLWECSVDCGCVQTATGVWTTKADCESQVNTCCYTGTPRYDCVMGGNSICKCTPSTWGVYGSLNDCLLGTPTQNCCEVIVSSCIDKCEGKSVSWTSIKHDGTYFINFTTTYNLSGLNDNGTWVPNNTSYLPAYDIVKDPYDGCCYVLVADGCHLPGSAIMLHSPSEVYNNHMNGLFFDGSNIMNVPPYAYPTQAAGQKAQGRRPVWWPCDVHCPTITMTGWDCDNCPGSCNCIPNNTLSAQHQGANALAACQAVCVQGCDDCSTSLSGYLTGPVDYEGIWNASFGHYNINDCVVDPADNCCYCCVDEKNPCTPDTPPKKCQWGETWYPYPICKCLQPTEPHEPHSSAKKANPCTQIKCQPGETWYPNPICRCIPDDTGPGGSGFGCKSSYQPSLNEGVSIGSNAMWKGCNYTVDGSSCRSRRTNDIDCNNCDVYMNTQWGVPLPLIWKSNPLSVQHFGPGDCVDVPNAGCCYCCVMSPTNDPGVFGEKWQSDPHNGLAACAIYDMNNDGNWEFYGLGPSTWPVPGAYYGWVSCSSDGSFPCVSGGTTMNYSCDLVPTLLDPNNMECVPDQNGPYSSLTQCQNSPCPAPPPPPPPCYLCCMDANGTTPVYITPQLAPCDCLWAGQGYYSVPLNVCRGLPCIQTQACPQGYIWSQVICDCVVEDHDVVGDGCIQNKSCGHGYTWSWTKCDCVVEGNEKCVEKECPAGKFWDNELCRCTPYETTQTDVI